MSYVAQAAPLSDLDAELRKTWPKNRTVNIVFHGPNHPNAACHRVAADAMFEAFVATTTSP